MSQIALVALGALLLYLALRVYALKRRLPFLVAYPLFVVVLLGGSAAAFVGAGHIAVQLGLDKTTALVAIYGSTAVVSLGLWFVARWAIGVGR